MSSLRMPVATASRKGVSSVVHEAEQHRVVLTSHGRPVAVVDSAERLDESARRVREAQLAVLDAAANLVSGRSAKFSLAETCEHLGLDVERVEQLAKERAEAVR